MLFSTWELNTNLVLTVAPIKVGQYYVDFVVFSTKDGSSLSLSALAKKLKLKEKFSNNREKIICRLFHNFAQFLFTISERKLDYYHQKMIIQFSSRVAKRLQTEDLRKLENF